MNRPEIDLRRLAGVLEGPLPGFDAHVTMAPSYRLTRDSLSVEGKQGTEAAVAILLFPAEGHLCLVLTIRRPDLLAHPGQISLPGGSRDPGESLEETSRRELFEEVGVPGTVPERIGSLSPLYIPPTNFNVFPFVFHVDERPQFQPQESEVAGLVQVPVTRLLDQSIRRIEDWEIRGEKAKVPFFEIEGHKVWGATAMILAEFAAVIEALE